MNLLVGFFVVSSLIILLVVSALVLGTKGIFQPEYQLYSIFESGVGLRRGTAVLFNGVSVGEVKSIVLVPSSQVGEAHVVLTLNINQEYQSFITSKSKAVVMRDKNLVSDRVINIETPLAGGKMLLNNDTLEVSVSRDIETVINSLSVLTEKVNSLVTQAEMIVGKVNNPKSTIGAMLNSGELYTKIDREISSVSELLGEGKKLLGSANSMSQELENALPKMVTGTDSALTQANQSLGELENMLVRFSSLSQNLEKTLGDVELVIKQGQSELDNAGTLVDAFSDFWFIKGKIKKHKEADIPILLQEGIP